MLYLIASIVKDTSSTAKKILYYCTYNAHSLVIQTFSSNIIILRSITIINSSMVV